MTNLAIVAGGLITSAIVSRVLGPDGRGGYVAWQSWAMTAGILALGGLPQALVLDDRTSGRHRLSELLPPLAVTLALGLTGLGLIYAVARPDLMVAVALTMTVIATQCGALAAAEAQRVGRMGLAFNLARALPMAAAWVAMGVLLAGGWGSASLWLLVVASAQALVGVGCVMALTDWHGPARASRRGTLAHTAVLSAGNTVTALQYRFDLLAVAALFPRDVVAFYATGAAAQAAVLAAGQARGMLWFARPDRSRETAQSRSATRGILRTELWRTAATAAVVAIPLALTAELWVSLVYGRDFAPSVPVVVVLCGVGLVQSLDYLMAHECLIAGRGRWIQLYRLPSLGVLCCGFAVAVTHGWPTWGIGLLPGLGYAISCGLFMAATHRDRSAPLAT